MKDERFYLQIYQAIGMRDQARVERLLTLMREESKEPLEDVSDEQVRRLARACHGPLLAMEARKEKERQ